MVDLNFRRGLHTFSQRAHAWMLPDGSWGWSNAGLIVGDGESLLFDTLFDLPLTREMLEGIAHITQRAPLRYVVNSHANGDHFYGNQLIDDDVQIIATKLSDEDMRRDPGGKGPLAMLEMEGPVGDFVRSIFGAFDFNGIEIRAADRTFEGALSLDVGGVGVEFVDLGPAHTRSDVIAYVPEERIVYAADLLFIGGTPIAWAGPVSGWVRALEYILGLDADRIVPGHGPVTDKAGVREIKAYLEFVIEHATDLYHKGVPPLEAAKTLDLGRFGELHEHGRIVQNVLNVYSEFDPSFALPPQVVLAEIAALEGFR